MLSSKLIGGKSNRIGSRAIGSGLKSIGLLGLVLVMVISVLDAAGFDHSTIFDPSAVKGVSIGEKEQVKEKAFDADETNVDIEEIYREAVSGNREAQYSFGLECLSEEFFSSADETNDSKIPKGELSRDNAFQWLLLSAKQGYTPAQHYVASLFYIGYLVPQNFRKAFEWYSLAAANGNDISLFNQGVMLYRGMGTEKNEAKALECLHMAVKKGNVSAKSFLAMLMQGDKDTLNDNEALTLFNEIYYQYTLESSKRIIRVDNLKRTYDFETINAVKNLAASYYEKQDYAGVCKLMFFAPLLSAMQDRMTYAVKCVVTEENYDDFLLRAEAGDPESCFQLSMYKQLSAPAKIFHDSLLVKAAMKNHPSAQYTVWKNHGNLLTDTEKMEYLTNAAESGIADAQVALGHIYRRGENKLQDVSRAIALYSTAAKQGNTTAMLYLGLLYDKDDSRFRDQQARWESIAPNDLDLEMPWNNVQPRQVDISQSAFWYKMIIDTIYVETLRRISSESRFNPNYDLESYRILDVELYNSAPLVNNIDTAYVHTAKLLRLAMLDFYTSNNSRKAMNLQTLKVEAQKGNSDAQRRLGRHYLTSKNTPKALYWLERAAKNKDQEALRFLGVLYLHAEFVKPDAAKALKYLQAAAKTGYGYAYCNLAALYYQGKVIPKDTAMAFHYFNLGNTDENSNISYNLALMYVRGEGCAPDLERAYRNLLILDAEMRSNDSILLMNYVASKLDMETQIRIQDEIWEARNKK